MVLSTYRNLPPFCSFLHQNAWLLCADANVLISPKCPNRRLAAGLRDPPDLIRGRGKGERRDRTEDEGGEEGKGRGTERFSKIGAILSPDVCCVRRGSTFSLRDTDSPSLRLLRGESTLADLKQVNVKVTKL